MAKYFVHVGHSLFLFIYIYIYIFFGSSDRFAFRVKD